VVASWADVERLATALPGVDPATSYGNPSWDVKKKSFAWERPLNKSDLKALGDDAPPEGPILAVRIPDVGARGAMIANDPDVYFTIPHFSGYPAVLIHLDAVSPARLEEDLTEAWLVMAPEKMAREYLESRTRAE
jgi:hypothetical protein